MCAVGIYYNGGCLRFLILHATGLRSGIPEPYKESTCPVLETHCADQSLQKRRGKQLNGQTETDDKSNSTHLR